MPQQIAQPGMTFEQALAELQQLMAKTPPDAGRQAYDDVMGQANRAWPPTVIPPQGGFPQPMKLGGPVSQDGVTFDGPPPQSANAMMAAQQQAPQGQPPQNALQIPTDERGRPVIDPRRDGPSAPQGAPSAYDLASGALQFFGAGDALPLPMSGNALNAGSRGLAKRELRSYTEQGSRKNALEDSAISQRQLHEAAQPTRDAKDFAGLPPHVLQEPNRLANGRFGKIPDEIKAARERGRQRIGLERRASEKYPTQYDENGEWMPPAGWSDVIDKID